MPRNIFREYDIRGTVGDELTDDAVGAIGRGIGTHFARRGKKTALVCRDNRSSSEGFAALVSEGCRASGVDVVDLGMAPTPAFYYATRHYAPGEGGVMVTGSHNPPQFNGFKISCGEGTIYGREIGRIAEIVEEGDFATGKGSYRKRDVLDDYRGALLARVEIARPVKVVADAGNGTAGLLVPDLLRDAGCEAEGLFYELDGTFPNHWPDPTIPENMEALIARVRETGAAAGVAFDGDADRIGAVDDRGRIIWGDKLLALYAAPVLAAHPGAKIIFEVKCSQALGEEILARGGTPIMWKTGHSLIEAKMREEGALLAGEMSGHIYFADRYFGYDDALYAALRLAELIANADVSLSEMADRIPDHYATPEIRVDCPDDFKFRAVEAIKKRFADHEIIDVDGARIIFEEGWGLVRASNTQPALVLRFEAKTEAARDRIRAEVENAVAEILASP
ncbi:MAG: phosphomannomutase [candidate division Zixibacteria bacterium]|nr:phosphomannomutase [candidate division Zixibacteria bacterium]